MPLHVFEHFLIGLALHKHIHFRGVDGLALHEHARHIVENRSVFGKKFFRAGILAGNDRLHLFVDNACGLFGIAVALLKIPAEEHRTVAAVADRADPVAHTPLGDHLARHLRDALDVVGRTRRNVMNDDLFRDTSAQRHADKVIKFINCHVVIIVLRSGQGVTCRHTAGNDGDFMNIIGMLAELCKDRVAGFVICRTLLVCFGHDAALFLRTHDDLIDPLIELQISDHILPRPCRQNGCLIEKICKVCSGESARHAGDHLEIHVGSKRLIAGMDLQDRLTPLDVGQIDVDLTVEPPGTKESGVKNIRTVGRRHDDDPLIRLKAVHLNKDLIEGLFPFIVSAPKTGSSLTAYGVDFIDEDNAGLVAFRHIK